MILSGNLIKAIIAILVALAVILTPVYGSGLAYDDCEGIHVESSGGFND